MNKDWLMKQKQNEQLIQQLTEERDAAQKQYRQNQNEVEMLTDESETLRSNL